MLRRYFGAIALGLALLPAAGTAVAHSLADLEQELAGRERYFQPIDQPATAFLLRDANGQRLSLADLRGEVVVLNFVYASCKDVCPLHAEKIARVQDMVNLTPMREQVRFVTITTDPVRDTPEIMHGYGPAHGLDPMLFILRSG